MKLWLLFKEEVMVYEYHDYTLHNIYTSKDEVIEQLNHELKESEDLDYDDEKYGEWVKKDKCAGQTIISFSRYNDRMTQCITIEEWEVE